MMLYVRRSSMVILDILNDSEIIDSYEEIPKKKPEEELQEIEEKQLQVVKQVISIDGTIITI